jgi:NodT family efflux transporter outer membrane factor (OMF) lipoprotein
LSLPIPLRTSILLAGLLAGGCAVGPDYKRPEIATPPAWQAPTPHDSQNATLIDWWARFNDPVLTQLQGWAEQDSPTLDQAVARIAQARANLRTSQAGGLPSVTGSASYSEAGQEMNSGGQSFQTVAGGEQGSLDASWEIDLWGKVRRGNEAARARIEARIDDWHDARVSLAAEVADTYMQYRGCEQLVDIYRQQASSQTETARLTRINANAGFTAPADAELAEASAASTRSSATDQASQCDLLVKSLVSLTAQEEPALRALLEPGKATLPPAPLFEVTSVPADVLRQRPDVASSERELAAASAEIGVATADLYPSLSLTGSLSANNQMTQWSFGPSISLPIFDGGRARAGVASARGAYDLQFASWRQTVRTAVLDVEQALVRLGAARSREQDAARAAQGYQSNFNAIDQLQRAGNASMIDRESARRNALDAERSLVSLRITQAREWIALYKALGGGWQSDTQTLISNGDKRP